MEHVVLDISQTVLSEQVDCIEVRTLHAAQLHEVHIALEQNFHLTAGVDVLEICVKDDLQQHAWCEAACTATFICGFDCTDIKMLNYSIKDAYGIILRNKVTDAVRKKKIIVLIVRLCFDSFDYQRIAIFLCPYIKREDSSDCGGVSTRGHG